MDFLRGNGCSELICGANSTYPWTSVNGSTNASFVPVTTSTPLTCNGYAGLFGNLSDFVTPADVCLTMGFGNYTESRMLDCDSETVNYYQGDSCDVDATNSSSMDGMQCGAMDCDYAIVTMYYDNGTGVCDQTFYEEYAFAMGCVEAAGFNLNLYWFVYGAIY